MAKGEWDETWTRPYRPCHALFPTRPPPYRPFAFAMTKHSSSFLLHYVTTGMSIQFWGLRGNSLAEAEGTAINKGKLRSPKEDLQEDVSLDRTRVLVHSATGVVATVTWQNCRFVCRLLRQPLLTSRLDPSFLAQHRHCHGSILVVFPWPTLGVILLPKPSYPLHDYSP